MKSFRLIVILLLIPFLANSQVKKNDVWFLLLNHYEINSDWSVGNEFHYRLTDFLKTNKQIIIRPFVTFSNKDIDYTIGYSYINNFSTIENNIWEQISLNHESNKIKYSHRFRLEHRFVNNFSNRFRYRFTLKYPISNKWFFNLFDEIWIKTDSKFRNPEYDRNWIYFGVGYKPINNSNIQLAYLHQNTNIGIDYMINPTIQLSFQYDF